MPTGISPLTVERKLISPAGGEQITFEIPNDFNTAAFGLRASGTIQVGTANAVGLHAGGASNIIKRIRIDAKGEQRLDVLGKELRLLNLISNQGSMEQVEPGLTVGSQFFAVTLFRQFQMPRMILPLNDRGILPNNIIRDVRVVVDVGVPSDILQPAATTTLAFGAGTFVEFFVLQAIPTPADPAFYVNEQVYSVRDTTALTSAGEQERSINTGGKYRHLIVYVERVTGGLVSYDDSVVGSLTLKSNRTEIVRQTWQTIRADNRVNFLLPFGITGCAVLDFTRTASPQELLDADKVLREGSDLRLVAKVENPVATGTLGIVGVRIFGAL